MGQAVIARILLFLFAVRASGSSQVKVNVHLDKDDYIAGEPVFVIWEYTNISSSPIPFDKFDPYCPEAEVSSPSLSFAEPTVFPYPRDGAWDCKSVMSSLRPGEAYQTKFLLNRRFDLTKPGKFILFVPQRTGMNAPTIESKKLTLTLKPSSKAELRAVYQPYINTLRSETNAEVREAIRVLADSGADFAEIHLLRFSSDPRNGSDLQEIAQEGLSRLKSPASCARLAELADHPELHHQQQAVDQLGRCADTSYMLFLFRLADRDAEMRDFALLAAGESGGDSAVSRLLALASQGSLQREKALHALGRTGSERAANALIEALPSLQDDNSRFAALQSLATLTHHESRQKGFDAQVQEWKEWRLNSADKHIYAPRDWQVPLTPLPDHKSSSMAQ